MNGGPDDLEFSAGAATTMPSAYTAVAGGVTGALPAQGVMGAPVQRAGVMGAPVQPQVSQQTMAQAAPPPQPAAAPPPQPQAAAAEITDMVALRAELARAQAEIQALKS